MWHFGSKPQRETKEMPEGYSYTSLKKTQEQLILQVCGGERSDLLLQLHSGREGGAAAAGEVCTTDHSMQFTTHLRHLHQQMHGRGSLHHERHHPPCTWAV
ncbi:Hypothetical predicted protein [Scomber scombrus]|uniref:Uncharacterized protein n=1 Tax=Scomber scombrus TaxID=13677 RepID=A0AAV1QDU0_SCOSC